MTMMNRVLPATILVVHKLTTLGRLTWTLPLTLNELSDENYNLSFINSLSILKHLIEFRVCITHNYIFPCNGKMMNVFWLTGP